MEHGRQARTTHLRWYNTKRLKCFTLLHGMKEGHYLCFTSHNTLLLKITNKRLIGWRYNTTTTTAAAAIFANGCKITVARAVMMLKIANPHQCTLCRFVNRFCIWLRSKGSKCVCNMHFLHLLLSLFLLFLLLLFMALDCLFLRCK